MRYQTLLAAFVLSLGLSLAPAVADDHDDGGHGSGHAARSLQTYPDAPAIAYEKVTIGDTEVHYLVEAGVIQIAHPDSGSGTADEDIAAASMFYISYRALDEQLPYNEFRERVERILGDEALAEFDEVRTNDGGDAAITAVARIVREEGVELDRVFPFPDASQRPITFSFNGGPGSSSVWLHLGVFGPQRVDPIDDFGNPGPGPHGVVPNEYSLLDKSDFVFIDPVSTGFSRAEGETNPRDFHGVDPDIDSVAEFIRRFISRDDRWRSPRFIAGESYGTTRAAGLSLELFQDHGITLNGVVLVSAVTDFQTIRFDVGNDLPFPLILPSYTATARFHGKLDQSLANRPLEDLLREVETFAATDYLQALFQGDALPPEQRRVMAQRVARYTGLSEEFIERNHLRVPLSRFAKELRREDGITIGRLDSRYVGRDRDNAGERYEFDPSYAAILGIYTASLNAYLRESIGFESDLPYEILTGKVWPWSYEGPGSNRYTNTGERLRGAITRQPEMQVFLASGIYDLATPYFAADYTMAHLMLPEPLRANIETYYYESGHMMYAHRPSLVKMKADLDQWYDRVVERALSAGQP
ncbi:MAG: peptidase S10 [Planctomycetota bacterium]